MLRVILFYIVIGIFSFIMYLPHVEANTLRCTNMGAYTLCVNTSTGQQTIIQTPRS